MMYTKALCPALVVLWAGRGWAGLPRGFPPSPARGRGPQLLWGGVWQPRAEGRAVPLAVQSLRATPRSLSLQVALLCGPPGLGKTTLAHVIARHVGYNVVEMNAR